MRSTAAAPVFTLNTPEETRTAEVTLEVIQRFERKLGSAEELRTPDVQRQITEAVQEIIRPAQGTFEGMVSAPRVDQIGEAVTQPVAERTLSIPQILVIPKRQVTFQFADFDLKDLTTINVRPIDDGLVVQSLRTEVRIYLAKTVDDPREERLEDYLVRFLIERNEVDYDAHADLLYKLAGQMVARINSYLTTAAETENVLLRNGRQLAEFIFAQMMQNYVSTRQRHVGGLSGSGRCPAMWQQLGDVVGSMGWQPCQHVFQVGVRIVTVELR
jgi:type III restriction enzyme